MNSVSPLQFAKALPAVALREVSVKFQATTALDSISLTIDQGSRVAVLGPNGGGKSTLLRIVLGLLTPNQGSINVLGDTPKRSLSKVGYVPQRVQFESLLPLSVFDAVLMGRLGAANYAAKSAASSNGARRKNDAALTNAELERCGILHLSKAQLHTLSGGQLQRVLIARALVREPQLLLLDEPMAGLDVNACWEITRILSSLSSSTTIICVTHDISFLSSLFDKVACLDRQLHFHASPHELTSQRLEHLYGCNWGGSAACLSHVVP